MSYIITTKNKKKTEKKFVVLYIIRLTMVIGENWILVSSVLKLTSIASTPSIGFDVIVTVISSVEVGLARLSSYITSPVCTVQKKAV